MTTSRTYTMFRDEPVDFVQTITNDETKSRHYRCLGCDGKIWTRDVEALEEFVSEHERCRSRS